MKLLLLLFSQKAQFRHNVIIVFKTTFLDYVSGFSISFGFSNFVVFFSHVHISGCVSCVFFPAVIEALKFLLKLFSTSSNMLFSLVFSLKHIHIVTAYDFIYLVNLLSVFIGRYVRLGHTLRNIRLNGLANGFWSYRDLTNFRILIELNLPVITLA